MAIIETEDHIKDGLDRLISFWDDKPNVQGLVRSYLEELQELEDLFFQLNNERSITTAYGKQLDVLGLLLNVPRRGRLDSDYREALKAKISQANASGTTPDIKEVIKNVTGADVAQVFNHYPAATYTFSNSLVSASAAEAIQNAHMGGVRTRPMWFQGDDYFVPTYKHVFLTEPLLDKDGNVIQVNDGTGIYDLEVKAEDYTISPNSGFTSLATTREYTFVVDSGVDVGDDIVVDGPDYTGEVLEGGSSGYEVVDDRGKFASLAALSNADINTGYIIDDNGKYIVDENNNNIRYIYY